MRLETVTLLFAKIHPRKLSPFCDSQLSLRVMEGQREGVCLRVLTSQRLLDGAVHLRAGPELTCQESRPCALHSGLPHGPAGASGCDFLCGERQVFPWPPTTCRLFLCVGEREDV